MNFDKINTANPMMRAIMWREAKRRGASRAWWASGMRRALGDIAAFVVAGFCALAVAWVLWMTIGGAK